MNFDVDEMDEQLALDNIKLKTLGGKKGKKNEHRIRKHTDRSRRRREQVHKDGYWGDFRVRGKGGGTSVLKSFSLRNHSKSSTRKPRHKVSNFQR